MNMLGKYDFIILYEHRARELENAVLLAMLLEKKGYKVAVEYRRSARFLFQKTDVVIVPFFYNNENVVDFTIQPRRTIKKVINLQYEQVFNEQDAKDGLFYPREAAVNARHIAWGEKERIQMMDNNIPEKNIFSIGHMSIDLNSHKYDNVYMSKEDISSQFGIPLNKKWHLFISSFSHVEISDDEVLQSVAYKDYDLSEYLSISRKSQKELLKWFNDILVNQSDTVIIYRPHPAEINSKGLRELERKSKNFFCISDYSIRQWIRISDSISTWFSTSVVDIYYAGKPCMILRPVSIPEYMDYEIYQKQRIIEKYEEFYDCIVNNTESKLDGTDIIKYYNNTAEANTFEKLADICEKTRVEDNYSFDFEKSVDLTKEKPVKYHIYRCLMGFASIFYLAPITPSKYKYDVKHTYIESKGYKKEIALYKKRFSNIV